MPEGLGMGRHVALDDLAETELCPGSAPDRWPRNPGDSVERTALVDVKHQVAMHAQVFGEGKDSVRQRRIETAKKNGNMLA